ncbi:hypothetical protein BJF85_13265 [Saccharomonospora sp. CUA-673]|uniref:hypothetical protein n=1 Tax=Saccharomonospora sp. CUA-673 TaxID=1904969 RepID=UPI00095D0294|nr:hypothetical protein [Saccharomonospora sp. CUA-673]OLT48203.1 hypothetical protein BJF85_13265 [Saccharomonospora sp. CUA-673]
MSVDRTESLERRVNELDGVGAPGRLWRGLTGSVAVGLAALAAVVAVASVVSDEGGPGAASVIWHAVGAVSALVVQAVLVDRRRGGAAGIAGLGVLAIAGTVLWTCWWS